MRAAMSAADVGDDVFREDPTAQALEARVAAMLGKESALFVPSGTMANQLALLVLTQRGDEVLVGEGAHCLWFETGAAAVLGQLQLTTVGAGGFFTADDVTANLRSPADWNARVTAIALENTHNRAGGRIWPRDQRRAVIERARQHQLRVHLDGARLCNASIATGEPLASLCEGIDTVSLCLSKGLGAPVGSVLAGPSSLITEARRWRKRLGGGMRQVGVLAAAGLYALDHHVERLAEDHEHARVLARALSTAGALVQNPESNIVMVDLPAGPRSDAAQFCARLKERGVLASAFGPSRVRLVTHLDVSAAQIAEAATIIAELLGER
jgi:threonine aldolase